MNAGQKEKRKRLLIAVAAGIINFIAIALLVVFIIKYKDGSLRFGEWFNSNNNGSSSETIKLGDWSCFALGAFGQIYLEDGQEMEKVLDAKVSSADNIQYKNVDTDNYTTGAYKIKQSDTSASRISFHAEIKNGKAFFHDNADNETSLERYDITLYPKDAKVETSDGKPYQIELSAWIEPKNNSELFMMLVNSNEKGFFSSASTMYCANMN